VRQCIKTWRRGKYAWRLYSLELSEIQEDVKETWRLGDAMTVDKCLSLPWHALEQSPCIMGEDLYMALDDGGVWIVSDGCLAFESHAPPTIEEAALVEIKKYEDYESEKPKPASKDAFPTIDAVIAGLERSDDIRARTWRARREMIDKGEYRCVLLKTLYDVQDNHDEAECIAIVCRAIAAHFQAAKEAPMHRWQSYKLVQAYERIMGAFEYRQRQRMQQAAMDEAPLDAVYKDKDTGQWVTLAEAPQHLREALECR